VLRIPANEDFLSEAVEAPVRFKSAPASFDEKIKAVREEASSFLLISGGSVKTLE
jgi:hypothetical protein